MIKMNPWQPISDPFHIRRLGKLSEELAECNSAAARCLIQGMDGINPENGERNRDWLQKEIADVLCQIGLCVEAFELNVSAIEDRCEMKRQWMAEWEDLLNATTAVETE